MTGGYADARALRAALDQRLRDRHRQTGLPLDRLRKEAALQRPLARIAAAPPDSWALKGGLAMIARVGPHARATADADATWRGELGQLRDVLEDAATLDLGDYFEFIIGRGQPIRAEGPEGGIRFPVQSRLAGRLFERIRLDVSLVAGDDRPTDMVQLRDLFAFAGLPPVVVPAVRPDQQLAEKLHAYVRDYGTGNNTRAKDLYDMLVVAEQLPLPTAGELADACRVTFEMRSTDWPPTLAPPPDSWSGAWASFVGRLRHRVRHPGLRVRRADHVLGPVLDGVAPDQRWDPDSRAWRPAAGRG